MADRKITDFAVVTSLASGYLLPIVDLSEVALIDQNKQVSIAVFDARYVQASGASISGQLIVPSGTAAAPGIGIGEPDTGFYSPANNAIGISANGTQIVTFTTSTATFVPALTISGSKAVITAVSGSNANFTTISGANINTSTISGTSALFTTYSGAQAYLTSLSGTNTTFSTLTGPAAVINLITGSNASFTTLSGTNTHTSTISGTSAFFTTYSGSTAEFSSLSGTNTTFSNLTGPTAVIDSIEGLNSNFTTVSGTNAFFTDITATTVNTVFTTLSGNTGIFTTNLELPVGTTAERPTPVSSGSIRYNSERPGFEGYNGTAWTSVGGGATGSGTDEVFVLNQAVVSGTYTIPSGYNASSVGPITVASGVVVTLPSGSVWAVI